jgi:hypothetical protein
MPTNTIPPSAARMYGFAPFKNLPLLTGDRRLGRTKIPQAAFSNCQEVHCPEVPVTHCQEVPFSVSQICGNVTPDALC